jgi:uncharacterized small protein (DUF1192 family)
MEMTDRPPYVRFEQRAEEDRNASIEAGHYIAKNVNYALITPPGSKDCVEKVAEDWLTQIKDKAREGTFSPQWAAHFEFSFKQWQEENTVPENGTPIKGWALLSPAMQQQVLAANIRTVEDLAVMNESGLARVGMGARDLQRKAAAWLEEARSTGAVASKNAAMQMQVEQMQQRIAALEDENKTLAAQSSKKQRQQA